MVIQKSFQVTILLKAWSSYNKRGGIGQTLKKGSEHSSKKLQIAEIVWRNSPAVTAIRNSVDSSYSGNYNYECQTRESIQVLSWGIKMILQNKTLKQYLRILRRTKLVHAQHQSKLQVTASKLENLQIVVIESSLHV